jgi:hypothetical protein
MKACKIAAIADPLHRARSASFLAEYETAPVKMVPSKLFESSTLEAAILLKMVTKNAKSPGQKFGTLSTYHLLRGGRIFCRPVVFSGL